MSMCCDYTAGMLREAVAFERVVASSDGAGGTTAAAPVTISGAPTRAHVKAASGREMVQTARVDAETKLKVTVRYFTGLLDSDTILIRGRRHNITWINNVEFRDRWLEVSADGGVAV
jgi:head-tail adaptor